MKNAIGIFMVILAFALPVSIAAVNLLSVLIVTFWLIDGNLKNKILDAKKYKLLLIPFIFPSLFIISLLWSSSYEHSFLANRGNFFQGILTYIWIPLMPIIYMTSIEKKYREAFITAFLTAMFFSEIISYLVYLDVIDWARLKSSSLLHVDSSPINPTPFLHHTHYSVFLGVTILLLMEKFRNSKNSFMKIFVVLFLISAISNLFINGGRTGQIGIVLAMTVYTIILYKRNMQNILFSFAVMTTILLIAYNLSSPFQERIQLAKSDINNVFKNDNYNTSWGARLASNKVALKYVLDAPQNFILGAGAGGGKEVFKNFAKTEMPLNISEPVSTLSHLHNQYFQLWIDGGIVALVALFLYFYTLKKETVFHKNRALVLATIVLFMFSFWAESLFLKTQNYLFILLMGAYFLSLKRDHDDYLSLDKP